MSDPITRGRFIWHELMTNDRDAAAAFYRKAVGWTVQPYPGTTEYHLWAMNGVPRAGLMLLPAEARARGAPPHWMTYISTPEVDSTAKQAEQLGGRVLVAPQDIPKVGRFAVLKDPQTAVFAVMNPIGPDREAPQPVDIGDFSWHELITTDWRTAWRFYQALFGWELTESMDMGPAGTYQIFGRKGKNLGGMYNMPPGTPTPCWLAYVRVPNADHSAAAAKTAGGMVFMQPIEIPGGDRVAGFADPEGAMLAVHAVAAQAPVKGKPSKKPAKKRAARKKPARKKPARQKPARRKVAKRPARARRRRR